MSSVSICNISRAAQDATFFNGESCRALIRLWRRRIHVVAGEPVSILDDPLLVDVHEDLLAADGADAVGEVLGGHP